jgi:hypothetical protein
MSGGTAWGDITGTLSAQTDLQSALDGKVDENVAITGATKTKITYDAKGLVTSGADATTADIADSLNRRYVTDAQLTVVGNTSGTNTGNQTSIVGISGTKAEFDTACSDGNFLYVGDITGLTDGDKGDITVSASGATWTIDNNAVTNAKLDDMAGHTVKVRVGGSSGDPSDLAMGSHSALVRNGGDIVAADAAVNTVLCRASGNTLQFDKVTASMTAITGTPDGTKYLRDDFSWAIVTGGSGLTQPQVMARLSVGF